VVSYSADLPVKIVKRAPNPITYIHSTCKKRNIYNQKGIFMIYIIGNIEQRDEILLFKKKKKDDKKLF